MTDPSADKNLERQRLIYPYLLPLGILLIAARLYLDEGAIMTIAHFLITKALLGKVFKAYLLLRFLRLVRSLLPLLALCFIAYAVLVHVLRISWPGLARVLQRIRLWSEGHMSIFHRAPLAVAGVVIAATTATVYWRALLFSFHSEDFGIVKAFYSHGLKVFLPWAFHGGFHYVPLGVVICGLPSVLFGLNPFWFHLQVLLTHGANCFLITYLTYRMTASGPTSLAAGLVFCTFYLNYEPLFWLNAGAWYCSVTLFLLTALLCFRTYLDTGRGRYYWGFVALYSAAQFTLEIASVFLPICVLYEILFFPQGRIRSVGVAKWVGALASRLKKYVIPVIILLAHMGIKWIYGADVMRLGVYTRGRAGMVKKVLQSFLGALMPGNVIDFWGVDLSRGDVFYIIVILAALSLFVLIKGSKPLIFFYFWGIWFLLTIGVCTASAETSPRYFYVSMAGFSVFLVLLLRGVSKWVSELASSEVVFKRAHTPVQRQDINHLVTSLIAVPVLGLMIVGGAVFIYERQAEWQKASDIVTNVLTDVRAYFPENPVDTHIFFINIPDRVASSGMWPAYVFRNGLVEALSLVYGRKFAKEVQFGHVDDHAYPVRGPSRHLTYEDLDRLSSEANTEVIIFDHTVDSVRKLEPGGALSVAPGPQNVKDPISGR